MSLKNSSLDQVRVNICNNQTYSMTAALDFTTLGKAVLQGFSTAAGDLGKATLTSNLTSASNFTVGNDCTVMIDLVFASSGASNANHVFVSNPSAAVDQVYLRCVFHGGRGTGFRNTGAGTINLIECEAYDNNKSNTAATGGISQASASGGCVFCFNTYSHDNTGSNSYGFGTVNNGSLILVNCISDTNGGTGVAIGTTAAGFVSINSNYYGNTSDGVKINYTAQNAWTVLMNNNLLLNGGAGVNVLTASQGGILYNNGRGSGTQANTNVDVLKSVVNTSTDITYASNVTPWNAPTTGDFRTTLAAAKGVGRGAFTETDGTNTGTIGYPDIGAAQAIVPAPSGGLRLAGSGGLAA